MPLPSTKTPWPPRHLSDAFALYATCQVWWEGDADKLSAYAGEPSRPAAGGFFSKIRRLFWGTKPDVSQQPRALHVPVAGDIVQTAASLLLPDPVSFTVAKGDIDENADADEIAAAHLAAQKRVDLIFNSAAMHSAMLLGAESCSALGDVYARVVWNADIKEHAWLDFVDADQVIPEFEYGELSAATFWTVVDENIEDNVILRHLERHEPGYKTIGEDGEPVQVWGRIYHGLYRGTATSLGTPTELAAHLSTAKIPVVDGTDYVETGTMRLTAFHIPNAGRNPAFRGKPVMQHLGRSDIGDPAVIGLMDQIDETYSSLSRDVRLAKARLMVSEFLLDAKAPGKGAMFSVEQEVYEKVGGAPSATPVIEAHQFQIRVDDHLRTAEGYLRAILRRIGFSPYTFGMADDSGGAMTATEVDAKRDASTATYKARSGMWKGVLARAARTLLEVDAAVFSTGLALTEDLEVRWPPASRDSVTVRAANCVALDASGSASRWWRVRYLNPDYDEIAIREEVDRIEAEKAVADPYALGSDQPPTPIAPNPDRPDNEDDEANEGDQLDDSDEFDAAA
ncbi:hypothetical protein [Nocardia bovistercoris]|uniref:Phage portal protein n=1 Tax=Nocardia bovistercoris TaxID=2785916 RepID=A0A931IE14_9NOCA|nr:hypothetical protein [Nocardia bovistercoris]MBH0778813.1 hypothetical protein [Nocardia bovistercoris]